MQEKNTFIAKIAHFIINEFAANLADVQIILPNKRAKVFLLEALKQSNTETSFAPTILSIEELIQNISGIRLLDPITLLFEFYEVFLNITPKEEHQSFDEFSHWAKTALQDFNEIDRYLIEPEKVFTYLSEIKALERWDLEPKNKTELIDKSLAFWHKLPEYYKTFYTTLINKKVGYQGLVYREAVKNISSFSRKIQNNTTVFAGFNALNSAEEKIILHFITQKEARVFWDIDNYFITNDYHDVGLFIRRFKKSWKNYYTKPFEWATNDFQQAKNIQIIGTPKSVGQAKIAGKIIENLIEKGETINETALVLGDENLLLPALNALPSTISSLNITMGYPSKNNPAQLLVISLLKLHTAAKARSGNNYIYYYKDVVSILNHPFIEPYTNLEIVLQKIRNENYTFFGYDTLLNLHPNPKEESLFSYLFQPWSEFSVIEILETLKKILTSIKIHLNNTNEDTSISLTFLFAVYKVLNQIQTYQEKYKKLNTIEELQSLYKQLLDLSEVSFEGEPLSGLQIMGVLESRVLDFKNVIITSVNEGKFPASKSQSSFIPYDVKRELGLPTYKEKDAIYSYHFYHLLFRAQNIFLLYNTDNEGIDAGEKSRFLQQLEIENLPQHHLEKSIYNTRLPEKAYEKTMVEKSEKLLGRLHEIATVKGFSPSSLTTYIRNPIQFYLQRVLQINETDEVEEDIAANTLGTIIHDTLEQLYLPYINSILTPEIIDELLSKTDAEVELQFKKVYREGNIKKGRNFLAYEVAKRNISNFLQHEKLMLKNGDDVKVLHVEKKLNCTIQHPNLPYPVSLVGKIDRIEMRNGIIRIIDYKTGKVDATYLKLKTFEGLTANIKNEKIIQLLCYALMYQKEFKELPANGIEAGIVSFKNLKSGFLPFKLMNEQLITNNVLHNFTKEIVELIKEILNPEFTFTEKTI